MKSGFIGGFASGADVISITNCTVEKGVTIGYDGNENNIGSFGGDFNGNIINCKSYATVKGKNFVGGIVGSKGQTMAGQESLTTCPTAWEDTINFPDAGGSPPTSVWPGVPLTCMNCTATGTSSGLGCLSGETLRCTRKEATNGYLPSVTATGCSASVWTVTCNGWTAISMRGRRKRQSP